MSLPKPSPTSTAVVTGASSGIGADLARELASRGYGVTLVARREDRLRDLAAELGGTVRVEVIACDVADPAARASLFDEIERRGLTVDVLVNNAGIGTIGAVADANVDDEIAQVRVNVEAVIDLTTRAVGQMVARGRGAILNVGSTAGFQPFPGQAGYAAPTAFAPNSSAPA
jgi:short-subunit dehydrogenase